DIEEGWDYGYVEVSTDGGATWQSIPGSITTNDNPNGTNAGNGITGTSGGWVAAVFDLSPFAGREILLRFRYSTDTAVQGKGWCIDNVEIPEIGFYDDVEAGNSGWVAEPSAADGGWTVFAGSRTLSLPHYYLLELRTFKGFDEGLKAAYNFAWLDTLPNKAEFFSYNPGVLVWYRDMQYGDNWVGVHPGHGYLLVVDAHDTPIRTPIKGIPWRTRVQVRDATFGRERTLPTTLTRFEKTKTYASLPPLPLFNDTQDYWNPSVPTNSVLTPTYGVNFKVTGISEDGTSVRIGVFLDNGAK
ncbi:MAG TPA: protease, partial [Firmicutes bacterium]|nr:protease [Bacillota bacterium]